MQPIDQSRRATDNAFLPGTQSAEEIVQRGILLKHALSTVAAIEFLAARDVSTDVIRRVMTGGALRETDRLARGARAAT
jgi:hypothetical protein